MSANIPDIISDDDTQFDEWFAKTDKGRQDFEKDLKEINPALTLYDSEIYKFLVLCSLNDKIDEWNSWVGKINDRDKIRINLSGAYLEEASLMGADLQEAHLEGAHLEGAHLEGAHLKGAILKEAHLEGAHLEKAELWNAHLEGAYLDGAHLEEAYLDGAHLEGASLGGAHLEDASLDGAHLEGASLDGAHLDEAHLEGASLGGAHLEGASLDGAHLEGASLDGAHLDGAFLGCANFDGAHLEGASLEKANLVDAHLEKAHLNQCELIGVYIQGAKFNLASVDGNTILENPEYDNNTDFTGVGLSSMCINPKLQVKLETNIRRISWIEWYKEHKLLKYPIRLFWFISAYGSSTSRVIFSFIGLNLIATSIYVMLSCFGLQTILQSSMDFTSAASGLNSILSAIIQSMAVMFDISAIAGIGNSTWWILLITLLHFIFGYFVLASLIARISILFQNKSP